MVPGEIGVVYSDLKDILSRLEAANAEDNTALEGTKFSWTEEADGILHVTCPYGELSLFKLVYIEHRCLLPVSPRTQSRGWRTFLMSRNTHLGQVLLGMLPRAEPRPRNPSSVMPRRKTMLCHLFFHAPNLLTFCSRRPFPQTTQATCSASTNRSLKVAWRQPPRHRRGTTAASAPMTTALVRATREEDAFPVFLHRQPCPLSKAAWALRTFASA